MFNRWLVMDNLLQLVTKQVCLCYKNQPLILKFFFHCGFFIRFLKQVYRKEYLLRMLLMKV